MHIDIFTLCGNDLFQKNEISKVKKIESGTFKFLGLSVRQKKDGIIIDQNRYVSSLAPKRHKERNVFEKN